MEEGRLVLTEAAWDEIAEVLHKGKRTDGRPPVQSDRMFLAAVLSTARTAFRGGSCPPASGSGTRCRTDFDGGSSGGSGGNSGRGYKTRQNSRRSIKPSKHRAPRIVFS